MDGPGGNAPRVRSGPGSRRRGAWPAGPGSHRDRACRLRAGEFPHAFPIFRNARCFPRRSPRPAALPPQRGPAAPFESLRQQPPPGRRKRPKTPCEALRRQFEAGASVRPSRVALTREPLPVGESVGHSPRPLCITISARVCDPAHRKVERPGGAPWPASLGPPEQRTPGLGASPANSRSSFRIRAPAGRLEPNGSRQPVGTASQLPRRSTLSRPGPAA